MGGGNGLPLFQQNHKESRVFQPRPAQPQPAPPPHALPRLVRSRQDACLARPPSCVQHILWENDVSPHLSPHHASHRTRETDRAGPDCRCAMADPSPNVTAGGQRVEAYASQVFSSEAEQQLTARPPCEGAAAGSGLSSCSSAALVSLRIMMIARGHNHAAVGALGKGYVMMNGRI